MKRYLRPAGIIVVAAIVGFVLARAGRSGQHSANRLNRVATTAAFSLRYPSGWGTGHAPDPTGLTLQDTFATGPTATERLAVGRSSGGSLGSLPARFLASLTARPQPATVQLGPYHYDRYLDLRRRDEPGVVTVYLLATDRSTIVGVCATPAAHSGFTADCERVLATLRLRGATPASPDVDTAYALELNGILARLNPVRRSAGPGLRSANVATRARAARRLAGAEQAAASAAGKLSAAGATSVNGMLVGALRQAAGGYRKLATAAVKGDVPAYNAAESVLQRAQQALTIAFQRLGQLGYRLR